MSSVVTICGEYNMNYNELRKKIEEGDIWDTIPSSTEDVNIIKAPSLKDDDVVFLQFKKKNLNLIIKSLEDYLELKKLFTSTEVENLINFLDENYFIK